MGRQLLADPGHLERRSVLACAKEYWGRQDESGSTSAGETGGWSENGAPTAYTRSPTPTYAAGLVPRATGLEGKPGGPKTRVERGKEPARDQKKRSGTIGIAQKERKTKTGGLLSPWICIHHMGILCSERRVEN